VEENGPPQPVGLDQYEAVNRTDQNVPQKPKAELEGIRADSVRARPSDTSEQNSRPFPEQPKKQEKHSAGEN